MTQTTHFFLDFFFSFFLENKPSHNLLYYHFGSYDLYNQTSQTFGVGWSTRGLDDQTYSIGESKLVRLIVYIMIFPLGHKQYARELRMKVHAGLETKPPTLSKFKSVLPPGNKELYYLQADLIMV